MKFQLIRKHKDDQTTFEEDLLWKFTCDILSGLNYLHSNNIIHRDIKCLNLFVSKDFIVKIGDMGVSKIVSNLNVLHCSRVGTPLYLAPELIKQVPYDFKVDLWSVGCSMYHLAALEPPFLGENVIVLGNNIVKTTPKRIPNKYSDEMSELIFKLLSKRAENRPTSQQCLELIPKHVFEDHKNQFGMPNRNKNKLNSIISTNTKDLADILGLESNSNSNKIPLININNYSKLTRETKINKQDDQTKQLFTSKGGNIILTSSGHKALGVIGIQNSKPSPKAEDISNEVKKGKSDVNNIKSIDGDYTSKKEVIRQQIDKQKKGESFEEKPLPIFRPATAVNRVSQSQNNIIGKGFMKKKDIEIKDHKNDIFRPLTAAIKLGSGLASSKDNKNKNIINININLFNLDLKNISGINQKLFASNIENPLLYYNKDIKLANKDQNLLPTASSGIKEKVSSPTSREKPVKHRPMTAKNFKGYFESEDVKKSEDKFNIIDKNSNKHSEVKSFHEILREFDQISKRKNSVKITVNDFKSLD